MTPTKKMLHTLWAGIQKQNDRWGMRRNSLIIAPLLKQNGQSKHRCDALQHRSQYAHLTDAPLLADPPACVQAGNVGLSAHPALGWAGGGRWLTAKKNQRKGLPRPHSGQTTLLCGHAASNAPRTCQCAHGAGARLMPRVRLTRPCPEKQAPASPGSSRHCERHGPVLPCPTHIHPASAARPSMEAPAPAPAARQINSRQGETGRAGQRRSRGGWRRTRAAGGAAR